jgi:hypothetical protein
MAGGLKTRVGQDGYLDPEDGGGHAWDAMAASLLNVLSHPWKKWMLDVWRRGGGFKKFPLSRYPRVSQMWGRENEACSR